MEFFYLDLYPVQQTVTIMGQLGWHKGHPKIEGKENLPFLWPGNEFFRSFAHSEAFNKVMAYLLLSFLSPDLGAGEVYAPLL